jgi:hypothetical protein
MKAILVILLIGVIGVCWIVANALNKPVLNKMKNYYEDDIEGRQIANALVGVMILLSFLIGYIVA